MRSLSISGGSLFEKKSLSAVATALTGMSSKCISTFPSVFQHKKLLIIMIMIINE